MNKATALRITFILAAVLLAYLPAVWGEFLWDDALYITENPGVRNSDGIKQIWLEPKSSPSPYPLTFTVYWIEHRLWGLNPAGYHLVNIALHAANSILLALALARLRARGNWLAAAIFALHPVHVESVAWITELKDVLSGFFYFLALLAWLSFVDLRRARDYAAVLFFFLAAMLSKSVTCTFPLIALLITVLKLRPRGFGQWRPWLLSSAPLFAIALVFGALTAWWERHETGATAENLSLTLLDRCMIAARAPWFYVGKLIWPSHLMGVYPQWKLSAAPASGWAFLGAACVPGAILLLPRNRSVLLFLCSAFFLLTLAPALGFINFSTMIYSYVADHYQYLASAGWIALFATAANHPIFSRLAKTRLAAASGTILILTLGGLTFAQCRIYKNGESFFGDTLAQNPTAWVAWSNVGNALARRGDLDAALDYYHHALVINPKDNETIHKIGLALIAKGKPAESIEYLKIPQYPQAIADLGIAYYLTSRGAEAEEQFRRALDANPNLASAHYYLGLILMQRNDLTQAIAEFRAALRANPDLAEASFNLAVALLRTSSPEEGMLHMRRAITLKPELREAAEKLGIGIVP